MITRNDILKFGKMTAADASNIMTIKKVASNSDAKGSTRHQNKILKKQPKIQIEISVQIQKEILNMTNFYTR